MNDRFKRFVAGVLAAVGISIFPARTEEVDPNKDVESARPEDTRTPTRTETPEMGWFGRGVKTPTPTNSTTETPPPEPTPTDTPEIIVSGGFVQLVEVEDEKLKLRQEAFKIFIGEIIKEIAGGVMLESLPPEKLMMLFAEHDEDGFTKTYEDKEAGVKIVIGSGGVAHAHRMGADGKMKLAGGIFGGSTLHESIVYGTEDRGDWVLGLTRDIEASIVANGGVDGLSQEQIEALYYYAAPGRDFTEFHIFDKTNGTDILFTIEKGGAISANPNDGSGVVVLNDPFNKYVEQARRNRGGVRGR